jgi:proteasome lid subunit RPN8/RPN11
LEAAPREACGILAASAATPNHLDLLYPAANVCPNAIAGYVIDPEDHEQIMARIEAEREVFAAVFHSHAISTAEPSDADRRLAYPGVAHVITGMGNGFEVRAWNLDGPEPVEIPLEVAG